jgi:hypothetical protein
MALMRTAQDNDGLRIRQRCPKVGSGRRLADRIHTLALLPTHCFAPVVDMNIRLPFNLSWKKDNSSPLLQKFVAQVEAGKLAQRN